MIFIKQMETINRTIPSWKYDSMHIEHWQTPVNDLYQTRQDLEAAMPGNINWDLWDELVEKTRMAIMAMPVTDEEIKPTAKHVWVYNTSGKYIGDYNGAVEAGIKFDISPSTVYQSLWSGKPYYSRQLFFSYHQLSEEEIEKLKEMRAGKMAGNGYAGGRPKGVEKWVYDLDGNLLGHYSSSDEVAKAFGIERGAVNYYSWKAEPYKKKGLLILSKPL